MKEGGDMKGKQRGGNRNGDKYDSCNERSGNRRDFGQNINGAMHGKRHLF